MLTEEINKIDYLGLDSLKYKSHNMYRKIKDKVNQLQSNTTLSGEERFSILSDFLTDVIPDKNEAMTASDRDLISAIMDYSEDNIYFKDLDSRFIRISECMAHIFGLKEAKDAIGKSDFDFFSDKHAKPAFEDEQKIIRTGIPILRKEEKETWADGHVTWVSTSKLPLLDADGNIIGTFGISRDITDQKLVEEQIIHQNEEYQQLNEEYLAQNEELTESIDQIQQMNEDLKIARNKAEESDRLKSSFLANMSHEIRTPMNGILGFSDLLKKPNLAPDKQQKYIDIIRQSGQRMLSIINDIIDISKIESQQVDLVIEQLSINDLCRSLHQFFIPSATEKGLDLAFIQGLPDEECLVTTDKSKLSQIITNLLKNAIKFTNEGKIEFGYHKIENQLEIYVKDTGIGIEKEKQTEIFERFTQTDSSISRKYEGAGLGLSISKAYTELLGGTISLHSTPNVGSTFFFTLPIAEKTIKPEVVTLELNPTIKDKNTKKNTFLITESGQFNKANIDSIFDSTYNTIIAKNNPAALKLITENDDIDFAMVNQDNSLENLVNTIKNYNDSCKLILLTTDKDFSNKRNYLSMGFTDVVKVPFDLDMVKKLVIMHG